MLDEKRVEGLMIALEKHDSIVSELSTAFAELKETRSAMITATALEEQTNSVVRRLTEKWRENTEEITKLREQVETSVNTMNSMKRSFDLLYAQLADIIHCPFPDMAHKLNQLHQAIIPDKEPNP